MEKLKIEKLLPFLKKFKIFSFNSVGKTNNIISFPKSYNWSCFHIDNTIMTQNVIFSSYLRLNCN